jgi:serine/threonine-protein kinase
VALKVPHNQNGNDAGMLHEAQIMVQMKHPNIVDLITAEKKDDTFFMVLEYVDGESLDKVIRRERVLAPARALEIALDVCTAIAFAHSHKIIHRDLRPANILITKAGVAKVTDFGTSRILELQQQSYAPTRIGSPPYMAPEHFRGRTTFQSDLWSLGITIYEMLTGTVPFYDADPVKIAQAFQNTPVVPPHLRNSAVPKAFSEVVMRALAVDMGHRFLSAQEFLKALQPLREGVARETRPVGTALLAAHLQNANPLGGPLRGAAVTHQRLCRFCYKPLSRSAVKCPACGELN